MSSSLAFLYAVPLPIASSLRSSICRKSTRLTRSKPRLPLPLLPSQSRPSCTSRPPTSPSLVRRCFPLLAIPLASLLPISPVVASALTATSDASTGFLPGLTAAFILVLFSELGDKTFFISALLSMKYSRLLVLLGTMIALGAMTVISVGLGQVFHFLPAKLNTAIPFDDYAAVALLLWFGYTNIRDALAMTNAADDELRDAKTVVEGRQTSKGPLRVVAETSSVVFLAEWGDKSMLATVALAAAKSPWGVIVGGVSGHLVASVIAVVGGSFLGRFLSERSARLIAGVLFFVFAILTIFGLY